MNNKAQPAARMDAAYDRLGGGIPSVAESMEARSDRCEVRARVVATLGNTHMRAR